MQLILIETETETPNAERVQQMKKRRDILATNAEQMREHILELGKALTVAAN